MGLNGAMVFAGAVDEMQKSARNLEAIRQARKAQDQKSEELDFQRKKNALTLEEMRLKNSGTSMQQQMFASQMKEYERQQKMIHDGNTATIDQAEHKETQRGLMAQTVARQVFSQDPALQETLAASLSPRRSQVPGPQGGMIEGTQAPENTPEAVPSAFDNVPDNVLSPDGKGGFKQGSRSGFTISRIKALKEQGAPLLPQEEEALFKEKHPTYDRNKVLSHARQMAKDEAEANGEVGLNYQNVAKMVPQAEKMLYGESIPRQSKGAKTETASLNDPIKNQITKEAPKSSIKKIKVISPDGKQFMLPENQWEAAQSKGFKRGN